MNTAGAPELIQRLNEVGRERFMVGAGTVLDSADLEQALGAGASFVVMPTHVPEVVGRCVGAGIPVFPGALTPQEIHAAWSAGATYVKVFPVGAFGPGYLREIKGPFPRIKLLACGGVNAENIGAYFDAGASAAAFGSSIFRAEWLARGQYGRISEEVERLVSACRIAWSRNSKE